jgi:RNA polymerase sigma factor (sigma-70 family)
MLHSAVVDHLTTLADADLLEHFRMWQEPAALEVIAHRYGPLILAILRRHLRREADLEDAFQATFLVLVRKAATIQRGTSLSCWLHGVARRVVASARIAGQRRQHREQIVARPEAREQPPDGERHEAIALLRQEMARLPPHFQRILQLVYFEGKSREETAAALGCSLAVVKGVLERARRLLRRRLERRGIALSAGLLGAAALLPTAEALLDHFLTLALDTVTSSPRPAALSLTQEVLMRSSISPWWLATVAATLASCVTAFVLVTIPGLSAAAPPMNGHSPLPPTNVYDVAPQPGERVARPAAFQGQPRDYRKRSDRKRKETPLAKAIREFNQTAKGSRIGEKQSPLTEAEVIGAIRRWDREQLAVDDGTYRAFLKIAQTGELPSSAKLSFITYYEGAQGFAFDVWWVDLEVGGYNFRIRDRTISSYPFKESRLPRGD